MARDHIAELQTVASDEFLPTSPLGRAIAHIAAEFVEQRRGLAAVVERIERIERVEAEVLPREADELYRAAGVEPPA